MILPLILVACQTDEPSATKEIPDETPSPSDTTTEDSPTQPTTTPPEEIAISVVCDPTDNLLRFLCTVEVSPPQAVELSYVRADGLSVTRTVSSVDAASEHALPVYFLAPGTDYDVTALVTASPDHTATTSLSTDALPAGLATSLSVSGTSSTTLVGANLPCSSDAVAVIYDTITGDLVWYQLMDPGGQFGSVDMVQFTEDHTVLGESEGDVIEVDLMGEDILRLNNLDGTFGVTASGLFGNFHHDIMKRNGVYYVFYQENYGGAGFNADILDTVILFDGAGTELSRWDPAVHLDLPLDWNGDFLHTNTVFVDEAGDMLLSWLSQDTIAKITGDWTSPDFGTPQWILRGSPSGDLGNTITTDWGAISPSTFGSQHCLNIRPDGRLMLLDNDHGRGLVLSLDTATSTATVDAQYPTGANQCGPQGTAQGTAAGNAIVGCAGYSLREYDGVTGDEVWSADVQCPGGGGGPMGGAARWYPLDGW